jgi:hypothetical protein
LADVSRLVSATDALGGTFLRFAPKQHLLDNLSGALRALCELPAPAPLLAEVRALRSTPDLREALAIAGTRSRDATSHAHALAGYARLTIELERLDLAADALAEATRCAPGDPWLVGTQGYLALFRNDLDAAAAAFAEIRRIDPDNLLAAQGEAARASMSVRWPASRRQLTSMEPRPAIGHRPINLVFFFVEIERMPPNAIDMRACMPRLFDIARARCPECQIVLLTDEHTRFAEQSRADRVIRFPLARDHGMFERMRLQLAYLRSPAADRDTVFLDPDIVVNDDLGRVFDSGFDIALTRRRWPYPQHPFNGGVIFARRGRAAADFFAAALECYEHQTETVPGLPGTHDPRMWWGDQLALAGLVEWSFHGIAGNAPVMIEGARVAFLACWTHNFTPLSRASLSRAALEGICIVHFKGAAKPLMDELLADPEFEQRTTAHD